MRLEMDGTSSSPGGGDVLLSLADSFVGEAGLVGGTFAARGDADRGDPAMGELLGEFRGDRFLVSDPERARVFSLLYTDALVNSTSLPFRIITNLDRPELDRARPEVVGEGVGDSRGDPPGDRPPTFCMSTVRWG